MAGWKQARTDICAFARFRRSGAVNVKAASSIIVLHVGDLLLAADTEDVKLFAQTLKRFKTGPSEQVTRDNPVGYLGLELVQHQDKSYGMHQKRYISELKPI